MRNAKLTFIVMVVLSVAGCRQLGMVASFGKPKLDADMVAFVEEAVAKSGVELKKMDNNDPSKLAWDDVPIDQLPDHQRAAKEFQRAKRFSAHVMVDGGEWHLAWRRYDDEWMLTNVATALINPETTILYAAQGDGHFRNVKKHSVFKHFIPPQHYKAKKAHDILRRRMYAK